MKKSDDEIIADLVETTKWSELDAKLGLSANFKCEYCELGFLASAENYKQWSTDHLVPLRMGGEDTYENKVLACYSCKVLFKNRWDPRTYESNPKARDELISAVKSYIHEKKFFLLKRIYFDKQIIGLK